jgi:FkbM family methyltransferase
MLKALRNRISDSIADVVFYWPGLEPFFRGFGRVNDRLPVFRTIYVRAVESLYYRLRNQTDRFRRITVAGQSFLFDITDFTACSFYFFGTRFEPATTQSLSEHLKLGNIVLDIGANRGYFTVLAAKLVGVRGRVYSFEPNPTVRQDLENHVAINDLATVVKIEALALSDTTGSEIEFFVSNDPHNSGLSTLTPDAELLRTGALSKEHLIRVSTQSLDDWLFANNIPQRVDLIKMDVECAEMKVLHGAMRTLADRPPKRWIIETDANGPVAEFMQQHGYHCVPLDPASNNVNLLCTHRSACGS